MAALAVLLLVACSHSRSSSRTPRSAIEQLLVTVSAERAVEELVLPGVANRRVAIDLVGVAPGNGAYDDLPYLKAALEERLRREGATLVGEPAEAERVVAVRVGALATMSNETAVGIPSVPLLVTATPEIKLYRSIEENGYTKLHVSQRDAQGAPSEETQVVIERARFRMWRLFFFTFRSDRDLFPEGEGPG